MSIGEKIKSLRENKNMTQKELADKANTTKQNIYKYENCIITNIPSDKVEKIANALEVSPAYLMGWEQCDRLSKYSQKFGLIKLSNITQKLSTSNQNKVLNYAENLYNLQLQEEEVESSYYLLNAAHEIEGASEEDKKHDDDIMDDENF